MPDSRGLFDRLSAWTAFLGGLGSFLTAVLAISAGYFGISELSGKQDQEAKPVSAVEDTSSNIREKEVRFAEEHAGSIIARAEIKAGDIEAAAKRRAANILARAEQKSKASTQKIAKIKRDADTEAKRIVKLAEKKAAATIKKTKAAPVKAEKINLPGKPVTGWIYIGEFEKNAWISKTIKGFEKSRPKQGDHVELAVDVNFRSNKPKFPLYRMPPLLTPGQIPSGTKLKIDLILYYVGTQDYTWAKVTYTPG